jgi:hypothetical protein
MVIQGRVRLSGLSAACLKGRGALRFKTMPDHETPQLPLESILLQMPDFTGYHVEREFQYENQRWLAPLSRINAFVGPNNSGKSRFLRMLYQHASIGIPAAHPEVRERRKVLEALAAGAGKQFLEGAAPAGLIGHEKIKHALPRVQAAMRGEESAIRMLVQGDGSTFRGCLDDIVTVLSQLNIIGDLREALVAAGGKLNGLGSRLGVHESRHVYVPVLRGMRPFRNGSLSQYEDRTLRDYFQTIVEARDGSARAWPRHAVATGLDLFERVRVNQQGTLEQRERIRRFAGFLSKWFFGGSSVTLIPRDKSDVLFVKVGHELERPIQDLGDGIQHVIIMTSPLFLEDPGPLMLFIEEPELFLHVGSQRALIDALIEHAAQAPVQVFVATHSQQFLDLTLDTDELAVFTVNKRLPDGDGEERVPEFHLSPCTIERQPILRSLGVRNSTVLLTNCSIWVEGITDRAYVRHFLKLLREHERAKGEDWTEDLHYSFVQYGGANVVHWSFFNEDRPRADRLCGTLMLIADGDTTSSGTPTRSGRHAQLRKHLGDRFVVLDCKEMENCLSPEVIAKVVEAYDDKPDACWRKSAKWEDYRYEPLGDYIGRQVLAGRRSSRAGDPPYADGNSIRDKVSFCRKAIDAMTAWGDLTSEAQRVARAVNKFIASHNPKSCGPTADVGPGTE